MQVFELRPSLQLTIFFWFLHFAAAAVLFFLSFRHYLIVAALLPGLMYSFFYYHSYARLRLPDSIRQLWVREHQLWFAVTSRDGLIPLSVQPNSVVTRYGMLLQMTSVTQRRFCLILSADHFPPSGFRRLQCVLMAHSFRT